MAGKVVPPVDLLRTSDGQIEASSLKMYALGPQDQFSRGAALTSNASEALIKETTPGMATRSITLDLAIISDREQVDNPEWFIGRPKRSPERYMEIRNAILRAWDAIQPAYMSKTRARKGMKGDVNIIGDIFDYLERIGAINTGDEAAKRKRAPPQRSSLSLGWHSHESEERRSGERANEDEDGMGRAMLGYDLG